MCCQQTRNDAEEYCQAAQNGYGAKLELAGVGVVYNIFGLGELN